MRALVIGADGFAGRWLVRHLLDAGDDVSAIVGPRFRPPLDRVDVIAQADVRDAPAIQASVSDARPDVLVNLAGVSAAASRDDPSASIGVSVVGSMNVLQACARLTPSPRVLFVSTSYVYAGGPTPIGEEAELAPWMAYAAAKLAAERALLTLGPSVGVEVVCARPFNHIGPGQAESFLVPSLVRQLFDATTDPADLSLEDGTIVRDFSDVRDVAAAYRVIATRGEPGMVYNVASGVGTSVAELVERLGRLARRRVRVHSTGASTRHGEPRVLVGRADRLRALGWAPRYALDQTLTDMLASVASPSE